MNPNLQILIESPDLNIPIQSITISNPNPNSPISNLKSQILPQLLFPKTLASSIYFTLNGKPISDLQNYQIAPLSTLTLRLRLRGGGGDGGATGAESRDCYLNMYAVKKPDKCDPHEQRLSKWLNCSLSCEPLKAPVVIDKLGNLFNKEALVEALLKKRVPDGFGHIRGLKDMVSVDLEGGKGKGEGKFECPITGLEFNGKNRFVAIRGCGHVLSAKAFKEVKSSACLVCRKEYKEEDKIVINGNEEEVAVLRERLEAERGKGKKGKRGNGAMAMEVERFSGKRREMEKVLEKGSDVDGKIEVKKFKAVAPAHATKEVYASIFTSSSKKKDFKETYSCRSLPLGRN